MNEASQAGLLPPAEAVSLADSLACVPGAVVSRTLARNAAGTITLFAFDAGQGLSEHTAPFEAFVLVLEGEATLTIGGKAVRAAAGRAVVMPANVPHAVEATTPMKMLLVMLRAPSRAFGERMTRR
jgi:quercetin dioxygenase-like cupin family protein